MSPTPFHLWSKGKSGLLKVWSETLTVFMTTNHLKLQQYIKCVLPCSGCFSLGLNLVMQLQRLVSIACQIWMCLTFTVCGVSATTCLKVFPLLFAVVTTGPNDCASTIILCLIAQQSLRQQCFQTRKDDVRALFKWADAGSQVHLLKSVFNILKWK